MTVDYERGGWPLDRPGVRIGRLEEALIVIKGLMADGAFTFHGEHYQVTDLDGEPKPVQRPHPPIVIGGGGPKILALAARHAQIVGINANLRAGQGEHPESMASLSAEATDEKLARLRAAAGDGFDELEIQTLTGFVHVTDDRRSIAEAIASGMGAPDPDIALQTPALLVGTIDQIVEELSASRTLADELRRRPRGVRRRDGPGRGPPGRHLRPAAGDLPPQSGRLPVAARVLPCPGRRRWCAGRCASGAPRRPRPRSGSSGPA